MVCLAFFVLYVLLFMVASVFSILGVVALVVLILAVIGGFVFGLFQPTELISGICWAVALVDFFCMFGFFGMAIVFGMLALGVRMFAVWIGCAPDPFDAAWPKVVLGNSPVP